MESPPELTEHLSSVSCPSFLFLQDTSPRSFFDPTSQHRDWCPWVNTTVGEEAKENGGSEVDSSPVAEPGWQAVMHVLLAHKQAHEPAEAETVVSSGGQVCVWEEPLGPLGES